MFSFFIILILGVFIYLIVKLEDRKNEKNIKYLKEFAKLNKLIYNTQKANNDTYLPISTGVLRGKPFTIFQEAEKVNDNYYKVFTIMQVTCVNPQQVDFHLYKKITQNNFRDKLGLSTSFKTGDTHFDNRFRIESTNTDKLSKFFTDSIRRELLILLPSLEGNFYVEDDMVEYEEEGKMKNEEMLARFHKIADLLIDMANHLEQYNPNFTEE